MSAACACDFQLVLIRFRCYTGRWFVKMLTTSGSDLATPVPLQPRFLHLGRGFIRSGFDLPLLPFLENFFEPGAKYHNSIRRVDYY